MRVSVSLVLGLLAAGCAHAAAAPPRNAEVTAATPPTSATPSASPTPAIAATLSAPVPVAGQFHDECVIDMSHGTTEEFAVIAVRDIAGSDTTEIGTGPLGSPLEVVTKDNGREPFHVVVTRELLQDPDWVEGLRLVGLHAADVGRVEVYGIGIHGGWSLGLEIFFDGQGKKVGRASWGMRPANARACLRHK